MAQRATLVLTDRAPTPATHQFTPDGDDQNGVHLFSEKTGVPAGDSRFSASLRRVNGKHKIALRLTMPTVATQTINGVSSPVVLRTAFATMDVTFDNMSTEQERKNVIGMFASSLAANQSMLNELLTGLGDIY